MARRRSIAHWCLRAACLLACCVAIGSSACQSAGPPPAFDGVAGLPAHGGTIRVRIAHAADEILVTGPRLVLIRNTGRTSVLRTPIRMIADGATVVLDAAGERLRVAGSVTLASAEPRAVPPPPRYTPEWFAEAPAVELDGAAYAGEVQVQAGGDGLTAINVVDLEQYVASVIARELYPSWHPAAFEAQAVAARSYAVHEMGEALRARRGYDVMASTADQAFGGRTTLRRAIDATIATRGRILSWRGRPLKAYYSSTAGGRSASAADTWPDGPGFGYNLAAPLQARRIVHASEASPYHRWTVRRSTEDVTRRLRAWGATNGHDLRLARDVVFIGVHSTNRVGRPTHYSVHERNGVSYVLEAEQLRGALNAAAEGLPAATGDQLVRSGDLEAVASGGHFVFRGRGFGHGVGMCQFSAHALAMRRWHAERILANFYPGARVERVY
ncbi:MAG: SpoIID/LytB domain-containing protein [Planctomycetota bacterium]